ncbi:MAG: tetratricopeptide repeat protein [Xenococcaceae cyanobacterium MO_188.B19]|nr:tetratricopeptide repeat protein [Xenococcaceae cyanobacterium MO_188.B19]
MAILQRVFLVSWFLILSIFYWNHAVFAACLPNIADVFNTGINNIRQQNYQQAVIDFTQVIDRQEDLVGAAYSNRCLANLQLQNYAAAETDCITAVENNSDNLEAYLNLGLAYYRQGAYEQAIAQYERVIQGDEKNYRAYYNRGLGYLALNSYQNAIADYQQALFLSSDLNPESKSLIYNDLALAYMMLAKDEPAVFNFNRAIALDANNYNAYYNRGCAYHRQGKYQAAMKDFSQVVQLNPDFTQVYVNRAILQHQRGQMEAAYRDLNIALQQYQSQGDHQKYDLVVNLKQMLFYSQPHQLV